MAEWVCPVEMSDMLSCFVAAKVALIGNCRGRYSWFSWKLDGSIRCRVVKATGLSVTNAVVGTGARAEGAHSACSCALGTDWVGPGLDPEGPAPSPFLVP